MRTQPQDIISKLEADNSRLAKEQIIEDAMNEGLDEFFAGITMTLDKLYTFGVKQVPEATVDGQWAPKSKYKLFACLTLDLSGIQSPVNILVEQKSKVYFCIQSPVII